MKELKLKDEEINNLKSKNPFDLKNGERLMTIIFTSADSKIHYSFICKNTDKFNKIENMLYEIYPDYEEEDNFFTVNGKRIIKSKTIEQNNINFSDVILLNPYNLK